MDRGGRVALSPARLRDGRALRGSVRSRATRMATVIATIHQPEHLPWLGFFNKADQADVLVLLDTVQFRKGYFQNRNRILGPNGLQWLTVPVILRGHTTRMLVDMEISNQEEWWSKHWMTI